MIGHYASTSDDSVIFFVTDRDAPANQSAQNDKIAKFRPKVAIKVVNGIDGSLVMETPGRGVERKPVTIDTFLDVEKTHITILYSDPKDYEVDANKLHLGARNTGVQIAHSNAIENPRSNQRLSIAENTLHLCNS